MKKIFYSITAVLLLISVYSCAGYEPIFNTSKLKFKIEDYSITGDKIIGKKIYSRLYSLSRESEESQNLKNIYILIDTSKEKRITAKDKAGKALGYRLSIVTKIKIKDINSDIEVLNEILSFSSSYAVQEQFSETEKSKNKITENLINKTYQDLLIKLSEALLSK